MIDICRNLTKSVKVWINEKIFLIEFWDSNLQYPGYGANIMLLHYRRNTWLLFLVSFSCGFSSVGSTLASESKGLEFKSHTCFSKKFWFDRISNYDIYASLDHALLCHEDPSLGFSTWTKILLSPLWYALSFWGSSLGTVIQGMVI